jgi:uncharacterized protein
LDAQRDEEEEAAVPLQVTAIMIGVRDLDRAKKFYAEGLGDGSSALALYEWDAAAADAGVSPAGYGFRGVSFHCIVPSSDVVDEVMGNAAAAGAAS